MKYIQLVGDFRIYEAKGASENDGYKYGVFFADDTPAVNGYPEWQSDNLQECIDFATNY